MALVCILGAGLCCLVKRKTSEWCRAVAVAGLSSGDMDNEHYSCPVYDSTLRD